MGERVLAMRQAVLDRAPERAGDPADLLGAEEALMAKIQRARTAWTREAFYGRKSGFVVSVISQTIANALPNDTMKELGILSSLVFCP